MNIARLRHRAANIFLRTGMTVTGGTMRFIIKPIARFICGPLNPDALYTERYVKEQPLVRGKPTKSAKPSTKNPCIGEFIPPSEKSKLAGVEDEPDLEEWLGAEASHAGGSSL
jgi:hypothetical protein